MDSVQQEKRLLLIIRILVAFYIFALLFFGITVFPLVSELGILAGILGIEQGVSPGSYEGFTHWIALVYEAILNTDNNYPFLLYGYDWLAFAHIVIGVAFLGVYFKPVRNIWIVYLGMIACIGVIPLALICGTVRGIPFFWCLIDSSFCVFGLIPLIVLRNYIKKLEKLIGFIPARY